MNVPLPPEQQNFVDGCVARGEYESAKQVVTDALRQLERRNAWIADMREKIEEGVASAERGELYDGETVMREICERLQRQLDAETKRQGCD